MKFFKFPKKSENLWIGRGFCETVLTALFSLLL